MIEKEEKDSTLFCLPKISFPKITVEKRTLEKMIQSSIIEDCGITDFTFEEISNA